MPRHLEFPDVGTIRLPEGSFDAIHRLCEPGETAAAVIRAAVAKEIERRQREAPRPARRASKGAKGKRG